MKVLVTGGMGYLGRVVVDELIKRGHDIRVLDSLLYDNDYSAEMSFEFIKGDIRDKETLSKAIHDVDNVIHLAAIVGESACNLDKELSINVNYLATRQLAQLCRKEKIKMIFSSTCSVYGFNLRGGLREDYLELYPLSIYAISKLSAEEAIIKIHPHSTIFRLGTLFGLSPCMRFDLVVNRFIAQAIEDRKITVFGGGQYRPFVHVQDVAETFAKVLSIEKYGVFNLAGNNYRITDVADVIERKTGCEKIVYSDIKDPRNYRVNSNLAKTVFGAQFRRKIEYSITEIKECYDKGIIKDYTAPKYNREVYLWLRRTAK